MLLPFGRNHKGQNIAGAQQAAEGIFGIDANKLSIPQAAFLAGLPQSPITYSPYENTGELKSDEDLELGLKRAKDVLYNMYRTGALTQEEYDQYKDYNLKQDFAIRNCQCCFEGIISTLQLWLKRQTVCMII